LKIVLDSLKVENHCPNFFTHLDFQHQIIS